MKFVQNWPRGSRWEVIWNSEYFSHTNAYGSKIDLMVKGQMSMYDHYFSNFGRPPVSDDICKDSATRHLRFWKTRFLKVFPIQLHTEETWPCHKKVKCQYTTFILAILVDLPSQWLMQRFSPKASSVLEKKIFKGFYHIWAWRPPWSTNRDHFSNLSFPQPKEAPHEIWAKFAQRRSRLKFWTFLPYKCIRKQNWPYHKKVKCQCTTIILATSIDFQFPMIYI